MRILINIPDLSLPGGVANYYKGLQDFWNEDVHYNVIGGRKGIPGPIILIFDYIKFVFLCAFGNYDVVLLNPSLGKTAVRRDTLFLRIAKIFQLRTVVFFRGWSHEMVTKINDNPRRFAHDFNKADKIIVLAKVFKDDLRKWNITVPIVLSSTKVDDKLIECFDFVKKEWNLSILFLTRVESYKGIFTTIEAFNMVKSKMPLAKLTIAGNGSKLAEAKEFVKKYKLQDVSFLGNVSGNELITAFSNASVYILPSHSEGMPNTVLEAMAFGLPVISRPVGGLADFFEEEKMGYLIKSLNPEEFAEKIIYLLEKPETCKTIGKYNHEYAKKHFMASKVAKNLEGIISNVLEH